MTAHNRAQKGLNMKNITIDNSNFTAKQNDNNKNRHIITTSANNPLFASKVALHAYEKRDAFTVYAHENIIDVIKRVNAEADAITDADERASALRFADNPRYLKRTTDDKCKNEKFSHMLTLSVAFEQTDSDEQKAQKRADALRALVSQLSVIVDKIAAERVEATMNAIKALDEQNAQQTAEQSAEQTADAQSDAEQTADAEQSKAREIAKNADAQTAIKSAQQSAKRRQRKNAKQSDADAQQTA